MKQIIILALSCLFGCEKQPDTSSQDSLKIVWRKQLGPKSFDQISSDPIMYQNDLLFGYQTETTQGYYRFNKSNGQLLKSYDGINSFYYTSYLIGNTYFSISGPSARTINLQTNEINKFIIPYELSSSVFATLGKENIYLAEGSNYNFGSKNPLNEYKIKTANFGNLKSWNYIWINKFDQVEDVFGTHIKYLIEDTNEKGEKVIYFPSVLSFRQASKKSKYKLEAVNLKQNKLLWESDVFEVDSLDLDNIPNFLPQLFNNLIICGISGSHLIAFDKSNGKRVWSLQFENQLSNTNIILHKGKISVMDNARNLYLIDAATGTIIRKQDLVAGATAKWVIHNDRIYFTTATGKLYGIDANTHNVFWEARSPNKEKCSYCSFFFASPVVDAGTNRLYISDRKEVICYQLPK